MKIITSLFLFLISLSISAQRVVPYIIDHVGTSKSNSIDGILAAGVNIVYQENFEGTATTFPHKGITSTTQSTDGGFLIGTSQQSNVGQAWKVPAHSRFAYSNDDHCNCDKSVDVLTFPLTSLSGQSNMYLLFDAYFNRFSGVEKAWVEYDTGNGYQKLLELKPNVQWQLYQVSLKGTDNKSAKVRIHYSDGGSWGSGLAVDNVSICEAAHHSDLAIDSVWVGGLNYQDYYKQVPARQASGLAMNISTKRANMGKAPSTNSNSNLLVSGIDSKSHGGKKQLVLAGHAIKDTIYKGYSPSDGLGTYEFRVFPQSDSVDANTSNDTIQFGIKVTDTTYSRLGDESAKRGFSFGPGVVFTLAYQIELYAPDTINSMSVFIDENTEEGSEIDLQIFSEFFPNVSGDLIKDTFPQYNENIVVTKERMGKWMTFRVPQTYLLPGKYFIGVTSRKKHVLIGVSENPVTAGLVKSRVAGGGGNGDYMPYVKINTSLPYCPPMSSSNIISKPACTFQNGQIYARISGGTRPLRFQWGANAGFRTDSVIASLRSGVYQLTVTDSLGCVHTEDVSVDGASSFSINLIQKTNEKCFGDRQGAITVSPFGGTPPYALKWGDGATDTTRVNLRAGRYAVEVTDASASGCKSFASYNIEGPKEPLMIRLITTPNGCFNDSLGRIEVIPEGGFGKYHYTWNGHTDTVRVLSGLKNGEYKVRLADDNGCFIEDSAQINGTTPILLSGQVVDSTGSGAIYLTTSGGTPPLKYNWRGPASSDFKNPGTKDITKLRYQGVYSVIVTDSNGCQSYSEFNVAGAVNTSESIINTGLKLWPNPTITGDFTIESPEHELKSVEILDVSGRLICSESMNSNRFEFHLEKSGIYFLKCLIRSGDTHYAKIVKP